MKPYRLLLILLAALPLVTFLACDSNNSMVDGEQRNPSGSSFAITPATASLEPSDATVVFDVVGGDEPMTWSVSDPSLGTIPDTEGRTVTYTRTPGAEGTNVIDVRDSRGNRAQARVSSESLQLDPAVARLTGGTDTVTFTVIGGSEPINWSVSNSRFGRMASTTGRSNVYVSIPERTNVFNTVSIRDANGDVAEAVVQQ